jgi:hypothetical protein
MCGEGLVQPFIYATPLKKVKMIECKVNCFSLPLLMIEGMNQVNLQILALI